MPEPAPQRPHPEAPSKPSERPANPPPPGLNAAPKPAEEGAIFDALLDAGAEARVAYTAERRIFAMVSEAVAPQLQPFLAEMRRRFDQVDQRFDQVDQRFDQMDQRFDQVDRRLDQHERRLDQHDRRLDQHDRRFDQLDHKIDALAAAGAARDRRLDVLVAQMRLLLGGLGLLVTVLIAVFGFLFTR